MLPTECCPQTQEEKHSKKDDRGGYRWWLYKYQQKCRFFSASECSNRDARRRCPRCHGIGRVSRRDIFQKKRGAKHPFRRYNRLNKRGIASKPGRFQASHLSNGLLLNAEQWTIGWTMTTRNIFLLQPLNRRDLKRHLWHLAKACCQPKPPSCSILCIN